MTGEAVVVLTLSHRSERGDVAGSARAVYAQAREQGFEPAGKATLVRRVEKVGHHHTLTFEVPATPVAATSTSTEE